METEKVRGLCTAPCAAARETLVVPSRQSVSHGIKAPYVRPNPFHIPCHCLCLRLMEFLHENQRTWRPEKPSIALSYFLGSFWGSRNALNKGTLKIILYLENHGFIFRLCFCFSRHPEQLTFIISCLSVASPYKSQFAGVPVMVLSASLL